MTGDRRQLAAVMLTDMVGYSSLTQRDEKLALELAREQEEIVRPILGAFGGRAVKSLGDGLLVEFASALDAVRCSLEIQSAVKRRNSDCEGEPISLRIGVHLGDVVHRDEDVYGDAVNIVARIEPHADHGGVCVSQQVYDQVYNKLAVSFQSIGTPELKNIDVAIQLYRITQASSHPVADDRAAQRASDERIRRIVVLPFANLSPDPSDEYFADGMTEELIERLAHIKGLRVIARTTAMHYKNTAETAAEIGRSLRVGMAVECSVRKAGNRVRITAQLIDTSSEEHLWSSRYDRELDDVFAIQDDIAGQITSAISDLLSGADEEVTLAATRGERDTSDMQAYTLFLQGRRLLAQPGNEHAALRFFEEAIARDSGLARARVGRATCYEVLGSSGFLPYHDTLAMARAELEAALAINETIEEAHSELAIIMLGEDDLAGAEREARRAIELNASFADPYRTLAQLLAGEGNIDEAVRQLEEAYRLDPLDVNVIAFLGRLYFYAGRATEALEHWERTESLVEFRTNTHRAEYYLGLGDHEAAEESLRRAERIHPDSNWAIMLRGFLAVRGGDPKMVRSCIEVLDRAGSSTAFLAGFVQLARGDMDAFWESMDRADGMHALPLLELMYSPLLEPARADPRYRDLMQRHRARATPTTSDN
ncbi:MAG: adenylate/guanylate cyclase domain-containing protein [Acidimicrobiales bacterium]